MNYQALFAKLLEQPPLRLLGNDEVDAKEIFRVLDLTIPNTVSPSLN